MHSILLPSGNTAYYHDDFSGYVEFSLKNNDIYERSQQEGDYLVTIPADDLVAIVAEMIKNKRIEQLEQMDDKELCGLK